MLKASHEIFLITVWVKRASEIGLVIFCPVLKNFPGRTEDISWGRCFFLRAPQSWWIWSAVSPGFSVVVPKAATRRQHFLMLHNYLFQLIYLLLLIWRAVIHGVPKSRTRLSDWSDLIWSDWSRVDFCCVCLRLTGTWFSYTSRYIYSVLFRSIFSYSFLQCVLYFLVLFIRFIWMIWQQVVCIC